MLRSVPARSLLFLLVAAGLLVAAVVASSADAAARPAVVAKGSCTEVHGRQVVAVFDVKVRGRKSARVKRGHTNKVSGGKVLGRLPTRFRPGTTHRALRVALATRSARARWRLGRRTATVRRAASRCRAAARKRAPSTGTATPAPSPAPPAPAGPGFCASAAVTGAWTGTGRTIPATPSTLSSAVASARAGDTIELADGVYDRASVTLRYAVRLRAAHQFGAVFVGGPTPRYANDTGLGSHVGTAVAVRASGAMVEGIEFRYYDVGIDLSDVANVVVQGNRLVSMYADAIQVWDTKAAEVRCNQVLDPYLAQDAVGSVTDGPDIPEAQDDYAVSVYGSLQPRVEHNYFFGVFNQTLSFKEGNWDAYAGYNTFEGAALNALLLGQNRPDNGPYSFTGLPRDVDRGSIVAEYNVFREVYALRAGAPVIYYMRSPIRVWHVNGNVTLRGNVIEQGQQGVLLECRAGSEAGCDAGSTLLTGNVVGGQVRDLGGAVRQVNTTSGVLVYNGLQAPATISANVFAGLPRAIGIYSDGVSGAPSYTVSGSRELPRPSVVAQLRAATPATDPDLSFGG
jgi:hypothetical protein